MVETRQQIKEDLVKLEKSNLHIYDRQLYLQFKNGFEHLLAELIDCENKAKIENSMIWSDKISLIKNAYAQLSADFDFFMKYKGGTQMVMSAQKRRIKEELNRLLNSLSFQNYKDINMEFQNTIKFYKHSASAFLEEPSIERLVNNFKYQVLKYKIKDNMSVSMTDEEKDNLLPLFIDDVNDVLDTNSSLFVSHELQRYIMNSEAMLNDFVFVASLICFNEMGLSDEEIKQKGQLFNSPKLDNTAISEAFYDVDNIDDENIVESKIAEANSIEEVIGILDNITRKYGIKTSTINKLKHCRFASKNNILQIFEYLINNNSTKLVELESGFVNRFPEYKKDLIELITKNINNYDESIITELYKENTNNKLIVEYLLDTNFGSGILSVDICTNTPNIVKEWVNKTDKVDMILVLINTLQKNGMSNLVKELLYCINGKETQKRIFSSVLDSTNKDVELLVDDCSCYINNNKHINLSEFNLTDPIEIYYISANTTNIALILKLAKDYNDYLLNWQHMGYECIYVGETKILKYLYKYNKESYHRLVSKVRMNQEIAIDILSINPESIFEFFKYINIDGIDKLPNKSLDMLCEKYNYSNEEDLARKLLATYEEENTEERMTLLAYIMHKGVINTDIQNVLRRQVCPESYIERAKLNVKRKNVSAMELDSDEVFKEREINYDDEFEKRRYRKQLKDAVALMPEMSEELRLKLVKTVSRSKFVDLIKYITINYPEYGELILENVTDDDIYEQVLNIETDDAPFARQIDNALYGNSIFATTQITLPPRAS